jgi:hypothetical protein
VASSKIQLCVFVQMAIKKKQQHQKAKGEKPACKKCFGSKDFATFLLAKTDSC